MSRIAFIAGIILGAVIMAGLTVRPAGTPGHAVVWSDVCPQGFGYLVLAQSTTDRLMCCRIFCLVGKEDGWRLEERTRAAFAEIYGRQ